MASNLDYLRTALLLEPRGHSDMFGAIITSPTTPDADFGVIFMESGGYVNMCGHGTIGVCTVAVEMGMVTPIEPITNITLDTPAGIVKAGVSASNGRTKGVTFENVPAFLYKKDVSINTPSFNRNKDGYRVWRKLFCPYLSRTVRPEDRKAICPKADRCWDGDTGMCK